MARMQMKRSVCVSWKLWLRTVNVVVVFVEGNMIALEKKGVKEKSKPCEVNKSTRSIIIPTRMIQVTSLR